MHGGKSSSHILVKCQRLPDLTSQTGYIGLYPTSDEVDIPRCSWRNSFAYAGWDDGGAHHCKTCGVFVFAEVAGPPLSVLDGLAPERRERMLSLP